MTTAGAALQHCGRRARGLWEVLHVLRRAGGAALDHDALNLAQATAYSAMFALFPALIVAASLVGLLPGALPLRLQLATFFDRVLPSNVSPLLEGYFTNTHVNGYTARSVVSAAVVSLVGATSVMATLMEGFRRAHRLPLLRSSFWPVRARALVLVPLSLVPMSAASVLVVFGHLLTRWVAHQVTPELRWPVYVVAYTVRWTVALTGSVGIIAVIYHLGTDMTRGMRETFEPLVQDVLKGEPWQMMRREWTWRSSLPGAAVATGLWFVSTLVFGVYVTRFANYSRVYGPVGAAIALMFWLYLIALSVLIGAEYNAQRTVQRRDPELAELLWKLPGLRRRKTGRIAD